eukprot:SAG31_NODE_5760_length_2340_cov_3.145917_3_plen_119_part_00
MAVVAAAAQVRDGFGQTESPDNPSFVLALALAGCSGVPVCVETPTRPAALIRSSSNSCSSPCPPSFFWRAQPAAAERNGLGYLLAAAAAAAEEEEEEEAETRRAARRKRSPGRLFTAS